MTSEAFGPLTIAILTGRLPIATVTDNLNKHGFLIILLLLLLLLLGGFLHLSVMKPRGGVN